MYGMSLKSSPLEKDLNVGYKNKNIIGTTDCNRRLVASFQCCLGPFNVSCNFGLLDGSVYRFTFHYLFKDSIVKINIKRNCSCYGQCHWSSKSCPISSFNLQKLDLVISLYSPVITGTRNNRPILQEELTHNKAILIPIICLYLNGKIIFSKLSPATTTSIKKPAT